MPNKTVYFSDQIFAFLVQLSEKEYPADDDGVSKVIQTSVKQTMKSLAEKHNIKIPKKLEKELKP
jgi:hypothetical protein